MDEANSQKSTGSDDLWPTPPEAALKSVNASLAALSQSPIENPRLLRSEKYQTEKLEK